MRYFDANRWRAAKYWLKRFAGVTWQHKAPGLLAVATLALGFAVPASAAQVACTPTAGFSVCWRFTNSGANQTITLPAGITSVQARLWGAAGGGANSTFYQQQGGGAGGGYATGTLAVTSGQTLVIVAGSGGVPNSTATTYGGGGAGGNSTAAIRRGGSGGGMSAVYLGSVSAANIRMAAGGGGGASPGADAGAAGAGGGGATTGGQDALPIRSGRGGTQTAGGAAATGTSACSVAQTAGAAFQGGNGGASNGASSNEGGGGGGGGYFGGGGGLCQNSANQNGGGGGGSSYIAGTGVTAASTTAGANFLYSGAACAGTAASGGASDPLYTSGIGTGSCYGTGGNGEVVIQYAMATVQITKVSNGSAGPFTFTGTNGWTSQTITTVTPGTGVAGARQVLAAASTATTITETIPANYLLTGITCTGLGSGGTFTPNLITGAVAFNAAATAAGSDISCTFTNGTVGYTVVKAVNTANLSAPGTLTYTITVDNTGFVSLNSLSLADTLLQGVSSRTLTSGPVLASGDTNSNTILESTEVWTYNASYSVPQTDIDNGQNITNTVNVDTAETLPVTSNTATTTITQTPAMTVAKGVAPGTPTPLRLGQIVTFQFLVTNTGNVTLNGVAIAETAFNGTGGTGAITPSGGASVLAPGASTTFSATYTVTQSDIDTLQ